MAWEVVALDIAQRAGISTPKHQRVKVGERNVLLVWRFDRRGAARVSYMSAMTMLEQSDGVSGDYVEIAERLPDRSAAVGDDLRELYDRAVLNVALHNTDDHLRNHGLLLGRRGWRLSPVFDINPNPDVGEQRSTSIAGATAVGDEWDGLMALAGACRLGREEAFERSVGVAAAAAGWGEAADKHSIPESQQVRMADVLDERIAHLTEQAKEASSAIPKSGATRSRTSRGVFARNMDDDE